MSMKRILGCIALGLVTLAASAQWTNPSDDVPAYNATTPFKPLPPFPQRRPADRNLFHPCLSGDRL